MRTRTGIIHAACLFAGFLFIQGRATCQVDCATCRQKNYEFIGCKNGKEVQVCTNNPNGVGGGFHPHKVGGLTDDCYDDTNVPPNTSDGTNGSVFDKSFMANDVAAAVAQWNGLATSLCAPSGPTCQICISWATTLVEMSGHAKALAVEHNVYDASCGTICSSGSDKMFIHINNLGTYKFYNGSSTSSTYDVYSTMVHEMGHAMGIGDFTGSCPADAGDDIMGGGSDNGLAPETSRSFFQADDLCAYELLYCCAATGVLEHEKLDNESDVLFVYPNPVQEGDKCEIKFSGSRVDGLVTLFDVFGRRLWQTYSTTPTSLIEVPSTNFVSGEYFVVLQSKSGMTISCQRLHIIK